MAKRGYKWLNSVSQERLVAESWLTLNRNKYARDLNYHYIHMLNLEKSSPEAYNYLKNGGFCGLLSGNKHTSIPMDQIIECTINRSSKDTGEISGVTENVGVCERWMRSNNIFAALKEHLNATTHKKSHIIMLNLVLLDK